VNAAANERSFCGNFKFNPHAANLLMTLQRTVKSISLQRTKHQKVQTKFGQKLLTVMVWPSAGGRGHGRWPLGGGAGQFEPRCEPPLEILDLLSNSRSSSLSLLCAAAGEAAPCGAAAAAPLAPSAAAPSDAEPATDTPPRGCRGARVTSAP
jgi:hypothetical protein